LYSILSQAEIPNGCAIQPAQGFVMGRFRLSKRQVTDLLAECFTIPMAVSTVVNQQQVISAALAAPVAALEPVVKTAPVCNADETSWRQRNAQRCSWLWTIVTAQVTLFRIAPSRSGQVARELLGEHYGGVAGTDRRTAYTWLKRRQYCWSHLLRDFQKILERGDDSYVIGWYLKVQADYLLMRWARVRDGTLDYFEFLAEFPAIQTQIRHWLTRGLTASSARTAATCRLLLAADSDLWRFVSVPGLEPTNNSAERALRHAVIWRRSSHGTQSDHGSRFVERILTEVETCRQQQRPVFDFLRDALIAYRAGQPAPSLLPAP
jgi:transposase